MLGIVETKVKQSNREIVQRGIGRDLSFLCNHSSSPRGQILGLLGSPYFQGQACS